MQRMAWPGPVCSSTVSPQSRASFWKRGTIAPPVDRLLREQIGGAHEDADSHAALGESGGQCRDHCGRTGVVNAAGEDDVEVFATAGLPRCSNRTSIIDSQRTKLVRGPTCPPHSRPSKMNRRPPSFRNIRSKPGDGTCRYVGMPSFSSSRA